MARVRPFLPNHALLGIGGIGGAGLAYVVDRFVNPTIDFAGDWVRNTIDTIPHAASRYVANSAVRSFLGPSRQHKTAYFGRYRRTTFKRYRPRYYRRFGRYRRRY